MIDGAKLHYAQGPNNGPALLLIHGQMKDWTTYMRVLPELAKHFQVYAVDCYGHGHSDRADLKVLGKFWKYPHIGGPELAKHFQVYAVDCYGHGHSDRAVQRYSNVAMGRDLK